MDANNRFSNERISYPILWKFSWLMLTMVENSMMGKGSILLRFLLCRPRYNCHSARNFWHSVELGMIKLAPVRIMFNNRRSRQSGFSSRRARTRSFLSARRRRASAKTASARPSDGRIRGGSGPSPAAGGERASCRRR